MIILAIETSCDETAISLIESKDKTGTPSFILHGDVVLSQAKKHAEYGGVFPNLAKREHAKSLVPVLEQVLKQATALSKSPDQHFDSFKNFAMKTKLSELLEREPDMFEAFWQFVTTQPKPDIDYICVTSGPGLEPALWVGINFALALGMVWDLPVVPVNHMEGHIYSVLPSSQAIVGEEFSFREIKLPILALLISGGHTELVLMSDWNHYQKLGVTKDDAVGEAFDKIARLIGLEYPGGPKISALAAEVAPGTELSVSLPRPMIGSGDYDFSFSGLKTAARRIIEDQAKTPEGLSDTFKQHLAAELEQAVADVFIRKVHQALEEYSVQTFLIGGGVAADRFVRNALFTSITAEFPEITCYGPDKGMFTDNSLMIAIAGYFKILEHQDEPGFGREPIRANGNLSL